MTCTNCRHFNSIDAVFCSRCATKLSSVSTPVDVSAPYPATMGSSNAVVVLVLGILSVVVCGVLGPIAWWMGKRELDSIARGELPASGLGMTKAGYICGIVGTVLFALTLVWVVFVFSQFPW